MAEGNKCTAKDDFEDKIKRYHSMCRLSKEILQDIMKEGKKPQDDETYLGLIEEKKALARQIRLEMRDEIYEARQKETALKELNMKESKHITSLEKPDCPQGYNRVRIVYSPNQRRFVCKSPENEYCESGQCPVYTNI